MHACVGDAFKCGFVEVTSRAIAVGQVHISAYNYAWEHLKLAQNRAYNS